MALSTEDVRHIATLARIDLADDEVERMREQLSGILEHFETLAAIDTEGVAPTAQTFDLTNVEREDASREPAGRDDVLRNAPRKDGPYFRVRAVLD
ncbi:MAG: Asp-tRNA(Asn)/Glu-tRNA(Gln) amidotransferase subunit GatC [Dehalococcoidia bacterium]